MVQTSINYYEIRSRRKRRWSWQAIALIVMGIFVVGYPVYLYLDTMITGGISMQGSLLCVDLKAMSSFEMDQDNGVTEDIPKIYRNLDGKHVLLTGQMWEPYATEGKIEKFTLVYSIANCCFMGPPKVQHLVQATVLPGHKVEYSPDYVNVIGTLHVGVVSADGKVQSVYRVDVEKVDSD